MRTAPCWIAVGLLLAGCNGSSCASGASAPAASGQPGASATAAAPEASAVFEGPTNAAAAISTAESEGPPEGDAQAAKALEGKSLDPEMLDAFRRPVERCAWKKGLGYERKCKAYGDFTSLHFDLGTHDAGFVDVLENKDAKARFLGAWMLASWGQSYAADKGLAARVVAAAEKETAPELYGMLGYAVGKINLVATGLGERIKALSLRKETPQDIARGIVAALAPSNPDDSFAIELTRATVEKSPLRPLRLTGTSALLAAYDKHAEEVCNIWLELANKAEEPLASLATAHLTGGMLWLVYDVKVFNAGTGFTKAVGKCPKQVDAALDAAARHGRDGVTRDEMWLMALKAASADKASAESKKKAFVAARAMIEGTGSVNEVRIGALRLLVERDPEGKAYAKKYEQDPDSGVAGAVKEMLAGGVP